jgi:hypothetical protein
VSVEVEITIGCVECGAVAIRLSHPDEEWDPGDVATYFCASCGRRYDLVIAEDTDDRQLPGSPE